MVTVAKSSGQRRARPTRPTRPRATPNGRARIRELSHKDGRLYFDEQAQKYLGISGDEFLQRWDRGDYKNPDQPGVMRLSLLIPFVR